MMNNITLSIPASLNKKNNQISFKQQIVTPQNSQEKAKDNRLRNGLLIVGGMTAAALTGFLIAKVMHKNTSKLNPMGFVNIPESTEKVITNLRKPIPGGLRDTSLLKLDNSEIGLVALTADFANDGEILVINRYTDPLLSKNLEHFRKQVKNLIGNDKLVSKDTESQEKIAKLIYDHICDTFPHNPQELLTGMESSLKNKAISLGEFIKHKSGVCRHRAALGCGMGEVINLENKNMEITSYSDGDHSWNYLCFNRKDPNNPTQIFKIDTISGTITKYKKGYMPSKLRKK